ncbi:hypothetical protein Nepgr_001983 [Nepenthes gracilis]|uniref:Uncharacterized protein n=1 Tax=Nepenthes gracilis TaxID=150966 RepID=A0AAD3P928_NEPGR|nr:hypothetical protein Nepgr_001983 [Nepenthes gracilis]
MQSGLLNGQSQAGLYIISYSNLTHGAEFSSEARTYVTLFGPLVPTPPQKRTKRKEQSSRLRSMGLCQLEKRDAIAYSCPFTKGHSLFGGQKKVLF